MMSADLNVSAFAARQKANRFLILQVGSQYVASEPELLVGEELVWRLPITYAPSRLGNLGVIGHVLVEATNGRIEIADGREAPDLIAAAESLYERATSAAGT